MRTAVDARTEHLRGLRVPEHATVGRADDDAVFHHFQRIDGGMGHHGAVGVDVALEGGDGMGDQVGRDERTGAVVHDHVLELLGHQLKAGKR